ncbi:MAG: hypothetical protein OHK0021_03100 [Bryobacter sp.]
MGFRTWILIITFFSLWGCAGSPSATEKKAFALPSLPPPIAENVKFPLNNRTFIEVAPRELFGFPFLAGGNVATYTTTKLTYKLFSIRCNSPEQAASYLFSIKEQMKEARFVASYGGYFSTMPEGPLFVYAKGAYVAGSFGLDETEAIELNKEFAARL